LEFFCELEKYFVSREELLEAGFIFSKCLERLADAESETIVRVYFKYNLFSRRDDEFSIKPTVNS